MDAYKKYLLFSLACFALGLSVVAWVNWRTDPFLIFGNNQAGVYGSIERQFKVKEIKTYPHNALLLGSSVVAHIDPDAIQTKEKSRFFNAAFSAALPEEIFLFIKQNLTNEKRVLIGLDLYMFNESNYPLNGSEELFETRLLPNLFSCSVLTESLKVLRSQRENLPQSLQPNGQRNTAEKDAKDLELAQPDYGAALTRLSQTHFLNYRYSERRIAILRELAAYLAQRQVQFVFFLNPINERVHQMIETLPLAAAALTRLRTDLHGISPAVVDLSVSEFSDPSYYYKNDPIHYRPASGQEIIAAVIRRLDANQAFH